MNTPASAVDTNDRYLGGELSLNWNHDTQSILENWSMSLDIYEGVDGKDRAELSLIVTSTDLSDRVAFTILMKDLSPDVLDLSHLHLKVGEGERENGATLEFWRAKDYFLPISGELVISRYVSGHIVGSFRSTVSDPGGTKTLSVSGEFSGKVNLSCNAFDTAQESGQSSSSSPNTQSSRSWTVVNMNHPFCAKYL